MLRVMQRTAFPRRWGSRLPRAALIPIIRQDTSQRRAFLDLPNVLVPPTILGALFVGLWTWKCFMMVIFQNKIIYMPGIPPNARWETIEAYKNHCSGVQWREERLRSLDGTRIALCVASVIGTGCAVTVKPRKHLYILYFQGLETTHVLGITIAQRELILGNASSLPPRLPFLSRVLSTLRDKPMAGDVTVQHTIVCCSYRGYWISKGRPSEVGIAMDAAASLAWIREDHELHFGSGEEVSVVIWGQSIGAGVATGLAARQHLFIKHKLLLKTLILETPFISIRTLLEVLYPQSWLPYKHLWPFLRNNLDSWTALGQMQVKCEENATRPPRLLILQAERDELVPKQHGKLLEQRSLELGIEVEKKVIPTALHNEVLFRPGGVMAVVKAIQHSDLKAD